MRAAAPVAPPRSSSSRSSSSGTSGAKAVKKLRKTESSAGKTRGSDDAGTCSSAQLPQDVCGASAAFCTPSLPCWAAAEHEALEQLTDAFFSRHRLHLRVWPVSAGSSGPAAAAFSSAEPSAAATLGGSSSSSRRNAGDGGDMTTRKGRAATAVAAASGREDQCKKEGRSSVSAQERKIVADKDSLKRAGSSTFSAASAEGSETAVDRSGSRRGQTQKGRNTGAAGGEARMVQHTGNIKKVKQEQEVTSKEEEEDEATRVRREQLLNVRAMLYDRVTENVSFTCTEFNTPYKPSRNTRLPDFLRLRGTKKVFGGMYPTSLCVEDAATASISNAGDGPAGDTGGGAKDNVEALHSAREMQQPGQKEENLTAGGHFKHEEGNCNETNACPHAASENISRGGDKREQQHQQQRSGSECTLQIDATPAAAAIARRMAKSLAQKDHSTTSSTCGTSRADDRQYEHTAEKHTAYDAHKQGDAEACGDPGKLKELQQSLLSDGFTGCWVLLLTEKYVPPTSPTALSPQHATNQVSQTFTASSCDPQKQNHQNLLSAAEQPSSASANSADGEGPAAGKVESTHGSDGSADARLFPDGQQDALQHQHHQQPRVRRIIVCGALIEVYSNNERQIAALWCLPCLSAHATRLLLQAFLPRVLLEALRIPDVANTPEEEEEQQTLDEKLSSNIQGRDGSGSTKQRKCKQEAGVARDSARRGEVKQQQQHQRQQRGGGGGAGTISKKNTGEETHNVKQPNGCCLDGGEKGKRRKPVGLAEETDAANVSAVRRGDGKSGGTKLCEALYPNEETETQPQQLVRPIKSVFAVYEDILMWPRQALFLIAASSRLGFRRHAEPLLGVPADEDENENMAVFTGGRKNTTEEKHNIYRKQPYLHVDAGLGPQWRECNCRRRFFSSRLHDTHQRKRKGASANRSNNGPVPVSGSKLGTAEDMNSNSSSRKAGGAYGAIGGPGAAAVAAGGGGTTTIAAASRKNSCCSNDVSPDTHGLLRFFSVSDLWAARLMPLREKRPMLQQAEATATQLAGAGAGGANQTKPEDSGKSDLKNGKSLLMMLVAEKSISDKTVEGSHNKSEVIEGTGGKGCVSSHKDTTTKQEETPEKKAETEMTAAAAAAEKVSHGGEEGNQKTLWSTDQQLKREMKEGHVDTPSNTVWPEETDGWSCLVPRGTSEQILREIYCDLPMLSETNFEECLAEEVDISQDEMCGLSESECKELLRWWDN